MNVIILNKTSTDLLDAIRKAYTKTLRQLRAKKGFTQEAIAGALGCDYTTYGKIEKGSIGLTIERAIHLAFLFEVSLDELLNLKEVIQDPAFSSLRLSEKNTLNDLAPKSEYVKSDSENGLHLHINIGDTSSNDPKTNEFMENLVNLMKTINPEDL